MNPIDVKIQELRSLTSNFIFIEYYSHESADCWKIDNEFTEYARDKLVLCRVDEGIEKALDIALDIISKRKSLPS